MATLRVQGATSDEGKAAILKYALYKGRRVMVVQALYTPWLISYGNNKFRWVLPEKLLILSEENAKP
jgi:hypothetical protein